MFPPETSVRCFRKKTSPETSVRFSGETCECDFDICVSKMSQLQNSRKMLQFLAAFWLHSNVHPKWAGAFVDPKSAAPFPCTQTCGFPRHIRPVFAWLRFDDTQIHRCFRQKLLWGFRKKIRGPLEVPKYLCNGCVFQVVKARYIDFT